MGYDLRDLYRPGSGLTLRRFGILLRALGPDAQVWAVLDAEERKANKPTVDQLRARQEHYRQKREQQAQAG